MFLSFWFFFFLEREQNKYGTLIAGLGRVALKTSGTVFSFYTWQVKLGHSCRKLVGNEEAADITSFLSM